MPTKNQVKQHEKAMELLKGELRPVDIEFILDNLNPFLLDPMAAKKDNAFFTPLEIVEEFQVWAHSYKCIVLDLCAGIGTLAWTHWHANWREDNKYICIEKNPIFVKIGQTIMPEAQWICAEVSRELLESLHFDMVISNPPFGTTFDGFNEKSELAAVRASIDYAYGGFFILPANTGMRRERNKNGIEEDVCTNQKMLTMMQQFHFMARTKQQISGKFSETFVHVDIVNVGVDETPKGLIPLQKSMF